MKIWKFYGLQYRSSHFNVEVAHATSLTLVTDCRADKIFIHPGVVYRTEGRIKTLADELY